VNVHRVTVAILIFAMPLTAHAHGFAQRYDLPVPLTLYVMGAAMAVVLSFVVIAFFVRGRRPVEDYPRFNLLATPVGRMLAHSWLLAFCRLVSVALLVLIVVAGLMGDPSPFKNIAPTMVWVIWWVGFAYVSGLVGDLWAVINPWKAVFAWAEYFVRQKRLDLGVTYPKWLGDWPAVFLFLWFVWAELVWPTSDVPASLAHAVITYSFITWIGMFVFGKHVWLRHGEAFSVAFSLLARFAPTEVRVTNRELCASCDAADCQSHNANCVNCYECFERAATHEREWNLRPWAVGLLTEKPITLSRMVFVVVMLSSVTFDGLLATPLWSDVARWILLSEEVRPLIVALQGVTGNAVAATSTLALLFFIVMFQLIYLLFSALVRWAASSAVCAEVSLSEVVRLFVLSLIPIALAYHLAHYLSFLLIVGQYMIPLSSDPLGLGWDIFGTTLYMVNIGIVNARFVWYTSVIAIIVGHIIAVYLAHVMAIRTFRDNRTALLSQIPMLILMVSYTMISLWILAQPVVETG